MRAVRCRRVTAMCVALTMLVVLALSGCTGAGSSDGSGHVQLTIGSKNDVDGQLLATMYSLLLRGRGYNVTERIPLGQTNVLDTAIKSGAIDMYPEFTGTALTLLNLPATRNSQHAYDQVKSAYENQFQITWLAPAYKLNDGYGLCTSRENAARYHLATLADLAPIAGSLTVAQQQDAAQILAPVEAAYGIHFKSTVQISEPLSFAAVQSGHAQVNECYTTDPSIQASSFVLLADTRNAFPVYNPAPLIRDEILRQSPAIATTLSPLQASLTTDTITALIRQVSVEHQSVEAVARGFLQEQQLLPSP